MTKRTCDQIETCEPRFALSASLPGDLLLEALSSHLTNNTLDDPAEVVNFAQPAQPELAGNSMNLLQQAQQIRGLGGPDGSGQTVAVIDSGVAWDHVALGGGFGPGYRVVGGWDFAENDADPYDDGPAGYHGSHVAGLLAGESTGFAGVAPAADLVALRVFDDNGVGQLDWIEASLQWVYQNRNTFASPITTVNLSVGAALNAENLSEARLMLEDELQLLRQENILVFAAAGNFFDSLGASDSGSPLMYPASSDSVVAVGSVDASGNLSHFSQRADGLLATSGESIRSAVPDHVFGWDGRVDDFASLDGTSMATPQVAAASMLVRQAMLDQGLQPSADDILQHLRPSTDSRIDPLTGATFHSVDLIAAIERASTQNAAETIDLVQPSTSPEQVEPPTTTPIIPAPMIPAPTMPAPTMPAQTSTGWQFLGSDANESYQLDLRDGVVLRGNGLEHRFESSNESHAAFVIDLGSGADSLQIFGSEQSERLTLFPDSRTGEVSRLSTNTYEIELRGIQTVVFDGGGGGDRATLHDSALDDTLRSEPHKATLSGIGFHFEVNQVPRIYVHATAGGTDQAFLNDSAGDDRLAVRPQFTSLRSEDAFQAAYGFERVYAYATAGGNDSATLYDSPGDDTMSISPNRSIISGPNYQVSARGFATVEAFANNGGFDTVNIYADQQDSQWQRTDDRLQWTGDDGAVRIARSFDRMQAFEQYQPIAIAPQSNAVAWLQKMVDQADERILRERRAMRSVFDSLGEPSQSG